MYATAENAMQHLASCRFVGNTAQDGGGAVYSEGSAGSINNCTFYSNRASNGGAIKIKSASHNEDLVHVQNCIFGKNSASSSGGALSLEGLSTSISTSKLSDNMGSLGSALYFAGASKALTMTNCNISGNNEQRDKLESSLVQVILVFGSSRVIASDVKFYNNTGTVLYLADTKVEINNCLFNNLVYLSSILEIQGASSLLLIRNTSFTKNKSTVSTLMLANHRTIIQKCRFEANGMNNTSTIAISGENNVELRLSGSTFIEPTFPDSL